MLNECISQERMTPGTLFTLEIQVSNDNTPFPKLPYHAVIINPHRKFEMVHIQTMSNPNSVLFLQADIVIVPHKVGLPFVFANHDTSVPYLDLHFTTKFQLVSVKPTCDMSAMDPYLTVRRFAQSRIETSEVFDPEPQTVVFDITRRTYKNQVRADEMYESILNFNNRGYLADIYGDLSRFIRTWYRPSLDK
jgi:hypothetical protein